MTQTPLVYDSEALSEATEHGKGYFFQVHEEIPGVNSSILADVGVFSISNTTTSVVLILLIIILLYLFFIRRFRRSPNKSQLSFEIFYEYVLSLVTQIVGDKKVGAIVAPYIGALMVYLLLANLLPLIPPLSAFYVGDHIPLFRGATTDFNTTFALALTVIILMQIVGVKTQGLLGYASHFIQIKQVVQGFRKSVGEGMVSIVSFFVGLIEILSECAKILSLSLRLFGNMFAHEVFMIILLGAFAFGIPAVWMGMGLLVGVIQSLVFVSLVTVYFSLVAKKH